MQIRLDDEAAVECPHCGEPAQISLDPHGGSHQEYIEDCQVCCRPWMVRLTIQPDGSASVWLEEAY